MCGSKDGRQGGGMDFLRQMKSFSLWIVVLIWRSRRVDTVDGFCIIYLLFRIITLMPV